MLKSNMLGLLFTVIYVIALLLSSLYIFNNTSFGCMILQEWKRDKMYIQENHCNHLHV